MKNKCGRKIFTRPGSGCLHNIALDRKVYNIFTRTIFVKGSSMITIKSFVQKLNNFCPFERKCTFPPRLPAFYETAIKNADFFVYPRGDSCLSLKRQENLRVKVNNSMISLSYGHQHFVPLSSLWLINNLIAVCRLNPRTRSTFCVHWNCEYFLWFEDNDKGRKNIIR